MQCLTSSGRGGLVCDSCCMTEVHVATIHSQELLLLELLLLLVLLATGLLNDLSGLTSREGLVLTSFDVKRDTNLSVNIYLLGQTELSAINSDALTSAHKVHVHVHAVFQLYVHVHHSLSCVPLRQYRACVIDSLELGITCLISLYYVYKASQSCLLCFLCHPYIPHSIYLSPFIVRETTELWNAFP